MKYINLALLVVILIILIIMIKKILDISKKLTKASQGLNNLQDKMVKINEAKATIDNTMHTSLPFFITIGSVISLIKAINLDYKTTTKDKRSLRKSVIKECVSPKGIKTITKLK